MTSVLVTGATDKIGRQVVFELLKNPQVKVRAASDSLEALFSLREKGVKIMPIDLLDLGSVITALMGIDQVFLLTPPTPDAAAKTQQFCEAMAIVGTVTHIVNLSMLAASPDAVHDYGRQHAQSEAHVRDSGVPYTFIRPAALMQDFTGANTPWIYEAKTDEIYLPIADSRVAWVDVKDVGRMAAYTFQNVDKSAGKTFTLTGGEALTAEQAVGYISAAAGRRLRYVPTSEADFKQRLADRGASAYELENLPLVYAGMKAGTMAQVSPDFASLTGENPTPFTEFVGENAAAWA